jgi:hypothetical protein
MTAGQEIAILAASYLAFFGLAGFACWFGLRRLGPFDEKE